ncbi:glycosyltransferase family 4 protein [Geomonas sp. RF6]|uniref:glycosyltransferase family 4 protein n=1 Tax=Geomonas sp. RF6 TaxID=2897342 RepID=UPI001E5130EF|nr:glycosyltransferase family 4 protein [Geomonas sp. RF6]UFS69341.1 glycosyltransferase family 4 protein [Geomonas sp. RF6]
MKLCYIADVNNVHPQRIVQHFAARGHEIEVVSVTDPGEKALRGMEGRGVKVHYVGPLATGRKLSLSFASAQLAALRKTRGIIRAFAPDIVHCLYLTDCGLYGALSGFHPLMVFAMGSDLYLDPGRSLLHRSIYRYVLRRADLIHTGSEHAAQKLACDGGRAGAVRMLPYGTDLQLFRPRPQDPELMRRLDLLPEQKIVVSTRALQPVYSVDTLILAIPRVLRGIPEARFVVVGSGTLKEELEALARGLGVAGAVRFVGNVPEIARYLNLAHLFVSTSLSDVFACSTMEAMACGKPVAVSEIPGVGEWIVDRWNGRLFPPRGHEQLAECLVETLADPPAMKAMGQLNRRLMEEKGDLLVAMEEMEVEYRRLLVPLAGCRGTT